MIDNEKLHKKEHKKEQRAQLRQKSDFDEFEPVWQKRRVKIMNNSGITDTASYDKSTNGSRHGLIEVSATCIIDKDKAIAVTNAILSVISPSYWSRLLKFEKDNDHISTSTDPVVIFF